MHKRHIEIIMKTQQTRVVKAKGTTQVVNQKMIYDLKHRVVVALNKVADRDTYQVGVDDLDKVVHCLTPEGIPPFLSCILDTDSEQKTAVRKECIRLMGTLASFHEACIGQHITKMVTSIVKRLKDQDSAVRDACVETVGVLASKLGNCEIEGDGFFVALVKPLFEALGEQSKQVQAGSALCLAKIIDNSHDPPVSILQRMLTRTSKMLKSPHFMAKSAVIELNRSIIQAGGAPSQNILTDAMTSIQEALKSSDWITRKAASVALGDIVSSGGAFMGSFKASTIRSLESCRFDKVKPVRDTVLQALQCWKILPGSDTPEPSEAGSSIKENFFCDYGDVTNASDSGQKGVLAKGLGRYSVKQRIPLTDRKPCQNNVKTPLDSKPNDWKVEISVPTSHIIKLSDAHNEESECSSVSKTFKRTSADGTITQDTGFVYVNMDDKQECSSVSNGITSNFVTASHGFEEKLLKKPTKRNHYFPPEDINSEEQTFTSKMDRQSLDSTVTVSSSQNMRGCCLQTANEMHSIRKQLLEIQNKQSNLMDLLQMFTTSTVDSLSLIQSKMQNLELVVDKFAQGVIHGPRYSDSVSSKYMEKTQSFASPRLSTCTPSPRPSIDLRNRPTPLFSRDNAEIWEEKSFSGTRSNTSSKKHMETWKDSITKTSRTTTEQGTQKITIQGQENTGFARLRKNDSVFTSPRNSHVRQTGSESNSSLWKRVKSFVFDGDLDSAYTEAFCSGDEYVLVELLDGTGPSLESLSRKTASDLLRTLVTYFLEQRYLKTIIPWLQQVVELSNTHGPNYLVFSAKTRQELLAAIEEVMRMEFSNLVERRSVRKLAMELHKIWGKT